MKRIFKLTSMMIILLLAVAACTADNEPAAGSGAQEAVGVVEEQSVDDVAVVEETDEPPATDLVAEQEQPEVVEEQSTAEEPVTEQEPPAEEPAEESDLLRGDDRSARLKSLTSGWGTNWEKRTISTDDIFSGGPPRDGIPSIDDPQFITQAEADEWLADNEPVISLEINGEARAYPLQILTWHEISNGELAGVPVAVTFCPLCNSAIVFDRRINDMTLDFGVSGLLRNSDLIMYDRTTETLWQQFTGEAIIGDLAGEQLTWLPSQIISYADFKAAYPDGDVLSRETGFRRSYGRNPYAGYDTIGSNPFLYNGPVDGRLPAVARVVTIHFDDSNIDIAYPYEILEEQQVINDTQGEHQIAVFWKAGTSSALGAGDIALARDVGATAVFDRNLNGETLTFAADGDRIIDEQTNSVWSITGEALEGPLAGEQLEPIIHADHFWFSWAAFRPDTILYGSE